MFTANTAFAVAQLIAASIANSISMFSDSGSMLVDSVSYLISIAMERRKLKYGAEASKLMEVFSSGFSVSLLMIVTIVALVHAVYRYTGQENTEEETVDGRIVLGFSLGNLVVDIVMCGNYVYQVRANRRQKENLKEQILQETKEELNMVAAFVHLFADTLRTITGLVAGGLEIAAGSDPIMIDSVATFVVCSVILFAACFVLYEGYLQYREYRRLRSIDSSSVEEGLGGDDRFESRSQTRLTDMGTPIESS
jgi:Co/Zn/Cd efflux system component